MYLYLVQHAEAVTEEIDPSRGLSEKGMDDIKGISRYISGMNMIVHEIFHSGKKRALQTAQVLATHLKIEHKVTEADGLSPMDEPEIWLSKINDINKNVMLVGHMPHMAKLASLLLCGNKVRKAVNFEMGSIVCLRKDDEQHWSTDWIMKPKMIHESVSNNTE
jgi:phosphohistidine phosphatase